MTELQNSDDENNNGLTIAIVVVSILISLAIILSKAHINIGVLLT